MTLTLFLWTAALALFFGLSSSFFYHHGFRGGMRVGLAARVEKVNGVIEIEVKHDE